MFTNYTKTLRKCNDLVNKDENSVENSAFKDPTLCVTPYLYLKLTGLMKLSNQSTDRFIAMNSAASEVDG